MLTISVVNKCRKNFWICLKTLTSLPLSLLLFRRLLKQFEPRRQGTWADSKEYWLLKKQNILLSSLLTSCFFLEVNTFLLVEVCGVSFHCLRRPSSGSVQLFGGFYQRCCANANIKGTGFNLVRPRPPSR